MSRKIIKKAKFAEGVAALIWLHSVECSIQKDERCLRQVFASAKLEKVSISDQVLWLLCFSAPIEMSTFIFKQILNELH